jgi:putative colanic acid biosynthesis acetyltransferase WcaF
MVLRIFGAKMGKYSDVRGGAKIWYPPNLVMEDRSLIAQSVNCYNQAMVVIGRGAIVSQRAYLCTGGHDVHDSAFRLVAKAIIVESGAWIATEAFIGPGVVVGAGAVLGARAVAFKNLTPHTIYIGNPAVAVRARDIQDVAS